jgi:hypothetical protein
MLKTVALNFRVFISVGYKNKQILYKTNYKISYNNFLNIEYIR